MCFLSMQIFMKDYAATVSQTEKCNQLSISEQMRQPQ